MVQGARTAGGWTAAWPGLLALLACLLAGPVRAAGLPDTIDRVRGGVVAVGTVQQTRRPPANFLGTGFAVGGGRHVITNGHVLPEALNTQEREYLAVFTGRGKRFESRPAKVVEKDADHDLALLEIPGRPLPALSLGGTEPVREGQAVAFTGFPIGVVLGLFPVTHRGIISVITPVAIPAPSAKQLDPATIRRLQRPFDVYQLDATAYPGNSGSPLFEPESGRVIGVINAVFVKESKETILQQPSAISYAIPAEHVRALLRRAGLSR